jgi:hypothetical protein
MSELVARTGKVEAQSFLTVADYGKEVEKKKTSFREKHPDCSQEYGLPRESTVNYRCGKTASLVKTAD